MPSFLSEGQVFAGVIVGNSSKISFVDLGLKSLTSLTGKDRLCIKSDSMSEISMGDLVELSLIDLKGVNHFSIGVLPRETRISWSAWDVLKQKVFVDGVALSSINNGFGIGVGSWICFLPKQHSSYHQESIGVVQTMKVHLVAEKSRNVVLSRTSVCKRWSWYRSRPRFHSRY
uniref:Ribosomal protein S1 n=1 Tax=Ophirina amphinema TaxID=2108040 RepID=A0A348AYU6_9EUKA|nr:ribosomal protein S1 [Ophirina amphinema]